MELSDFDYDLPRRLIAQRPAAIRGEERLMTVGECGAHSRRFADLPKLLRAGDLLIANDSRVMAARLFARKESGGAAEILIERIGGDDKTVAAQVRVGGALRPGARLAVCGRTFVFIGRDGEHFRLCLQGGGVRAFVRDCGAIPLPPYIRRCADASDAKRYQTVFARAEGSVAAPTAGLHFTAGMLAALARGGVKTAFVTLHIGGGTFLPVRGDLASHRLHTERFIVPEESAKAIENAKARGGRVIACGTTALRALEAAAQNASGKARFAADKIGRECETSIFIKPGFSFKIADLLLTNFHPPRATTLILTCAFGGTARVLAAYQKAREENFSFLSYGDAMLAARFDEV